MDFLAVLDISASGLIAQRRRMDVITSNLANIETTRTGRGGPYRRKMIVIKAASSSDFDTVLNAAVEGVRVEGVVADDSPFKRVFNPGHPDADKDGYLLKPNVDLVVETTNLLSARRTYEANITAMKATRQMILKALEIGR